MAKQSSRPLQFEAAAAAAAAGAAPQDADARSLDLLPAGFDTETLPELRHVDSYLAEPPCISRSTSRSSSEPRSACSTPSASSAPLAPRAPIVPRLSLASVTSVELYNEADYDLDDADEDDDDDDLIVFEDRSFECFESAEEDD